MPWLIYITAVLLIGVQCRDLSSGFRVICYVDFWSTYNDIFYPEDAEPALNICTHLIFIYASLNEHSLLVEPRDAASDIDQGLYERTVALKNKYPYLKIMIAIKDPDDAGKFTLMSKDEKSRNNFVKSAVEFVKLHSFDGIELEWHFPGTEGGSPQDKANLVHLSKKIREEFDKHDLLFAIEVSAVKRRIDAGIDAKALSKYAHFLNVMSYQYNSYSDGKVAASSPLHSNDERSINFTIQYYLKKGAHPSSLNMGIASDLTAFILRKPIKEVPKSGITGLLTKSGDSMEGEHTQTTGYLTYYEVCDIIDSDKNWTIVTDSVSQTPFAINSDRVISMENADSYMAKIKYAIDNKLGGIAYYSIDSDDFKGTCKSSSQKYPLLASMDRAMRGYYFAIFEEIMNLLQKFNSHYFWNGMKHSM